MKRSPDHLYELLPAIYRLRDAEQGYPLQALLRVINEQVDLVEADIAKMYDNWFIETCEGWVVPYIADLVGYEMLRGSGEPSALDTQRARTREGFLVPRRDVAGIINHRQGKGTLALLELLARDAANFSGRAVEFYRRLGWTQAVNYPHLKRGRTVDLREGDSLDLLDGPFDRSGRTVDVRRAVSRHSQGRYNIPGVGVFICRLRSYSVTETPAYCLEEEASECYTFSVLGQDVQLYNNPQPETSPTHIAGELNLPTPIRRRAFEGKLVKDEKGEHYEASEDYYGKSLSVFLLDKDGGLVLKPHDKVIPANLSDWGAYRPRRHFIAVDPQLGRIVFPSDQKPKYGVVVSYHYAFSADIGGGEYSRPVSQPKDARIYRVGKGETYLTINEALKAWEDDKDEANKALEEWEKNKHEAHQAREYREKEEEKDEENQDPEPPPPPLSAVIEIQDSGVYTEQLKIDLKARESLQIRAANCRPVIRLLDYQVGVADAFSITGENGSRLTLEGLLIMGRALRIHNPDSSEKGESKHGSKDHSKDDPEDYHEHSRDHSEHSRDHSEHHSRDHSDHSGHHSGEWSKDDPKDLYESPEEPNTSDLYDVTIRHCTLVPGRGLHGNCEPRRPNDPSLRLEYTRARVNIEHSILGGIQVEADERANEPSAINISDSILDATAVNRVALSANGGGLAYARLTVARSTVIGRIRTHAIALAENSIFRGLVTVGRRQQGCVRFCYVPPGSRTPRRYECQPELAEYAAEEALREEGRQEKPPRVPSEAEIAALKASERMGVEPRFNSLRYGSPAYCQLAQACAVEITRGADDESEMGVFHDLYQPQREANLRARLDEFTPAGADVAIIYAN
jgi:hypothetical protein